MADPRRPLPPRVLKFEALSEADAGRPRKRDFETMIGDLSIAELGWDQLVLIARRMLELTYPEDIFPDQEGYCGELTDRDIGAQFIVHLRRALAVLP